MGEEYKITQQVHKRRIWNYLKQMAPFERIWLVSFSCIILAVTIVFSILYTDFTNWFSIILNWVVSPISALSGVICVVLVARGSIYNWILGLFNVITYGLLALVSGYYGDVLINWVFFLPTQFLILIRWRKNIQPQSQDIVRMNKLKGWQIAIIVALGI